jgi:hypothetical protein
MSLPQSVVVGNVVKTTGGVCYEVISVGGSPTTLTWNGGSIYATCPDCLVP